MSDYDLAIAGGGINGTGIARDASGRGLRVLLLEQDDLASGTSSASTKLIHGGLRYLEHGAIRMVREALREREVLLTTAPHLVRPMRFVLPVSPGQRSPYLLRLGLLLYDWLGARRILPPTRRLNLTSDPAGEALKPAFRRAFEYSDCWVDDSRLVILNAVDAAERGAVIRTRTRLERAHRDGNKWQLILNVQGRRDTATARVLINAAGPWAGIVAKSALRAEGRQPLRLAKGSHIVVPALFGHERGYIFQNTDGRVVFALPFAQDYTLIGTTDDNFTGALDMVVPTASEIAYLCHAASRFFRAAVNPQHVVWGFAGVRSLYDESEGQDAPEDVTRDFHVAHDGDTAAPMLTIYGGKITTFRRLAEDALGKLAHAIPMGKPWTATSPLPGGEFRWNEIDAQVATARQDWPFLTDAEAWRLVRAYGTRIGRVLGSAKRREDLGPYFGPLSAVEVRYLAAHEWARTAEDVLWRRTKLGLKVGAAEKEKLARFMAEIMGSPT
jgi:glycerol-3-phosphate dehydrogenase